MVLKSNEQTFLFVLIFVLVLVLVVVLVTIPVPVPILVLVLVLVPVFSVLFFESISPSRDPLRNELEFLSGRVFLQFAFRTRAETDCTDTVRRSGR